MSKRPPQFESGGYRPKLASATALCYRSIMKKGYDFSTRRLSVTNWHAAIVSDGSNNDLAEIVQRILTPAVTKDLPLDWQGLYSVERAEQWIADSESTVMLVADRELGAPIGLLILSDGDDASVRVGYVLAEYSWGKGLASELVRGLIDRSRHIGINSLVGGVSRENLPSRRVLEKNGFTCGQTETGDSELVYQRLITAN